MIKEYDEVKLFIDRVVSSNHLDSSVFVDDMFTDEFNAFDVHIIGGVGISNDFYFELEHLIKKNYKNIVDDVEMVHHDSPRSSSVIVYLKSTMEIRSHKIQKIKDNILV